MNQYSIRHPLLFDAALQHGLLKFHELLPSMGVSHKRVERLGYDLSLFNKALQEVRSTIKVSSTKILIKEGESRDYIKARRTILFWIRNKFFLGQNFLSYMEDIKKTACGNCQEYVALLAFKLLSSSSCEPCDLFTVEIDSLGFNHIFLAIRNSIISFNIL